MSSFLPCSTELLSSYYFVKQKKCKRGLSKAKVLTHGWTMYLPPNLVSNLHPPSLSKPTRCNQHKGPTAPGGAQSPSSSPDAAPISGVGSGSPFICLQGGISSTTRAGIRSCTPASCHQVRRTSLLLTESTNQLLGFSRRRRQGLSISLPFSNHLLNDKGLRHRSSSLLALALLPASTLPHCHKTRLVSQSFPNTLC